MNAFLWILALVLSALPNAQATRQAQEQECRMLVGCCAPLKNMEAVQAAGFDYLGPSVSEIAGLPDPGFAHTSGGEVDRRGQIGRDSHGRHLIFKA